MAFRISADAEADLEEVWTYIAVESGSPDIARRFIETIAARFEVLAEHPQLGRQRNDLRQELRSHPVGNYVIFYRIVDNDILVLRVIHGRRDISASFR